MVHTAAKSFAVLGVGFAKVEAGERTWPIPDGEVAWMGWPTEDRGGVSIAGPPDTPEADLRLDGGRPRVTVRLDEPEASARASAVADAIAGMLASPQSLIPVETSVIPISDQDVAANLVDLDRLRADRDLFPDPFAATVLTDMSAQPRVLPPVLERLDVVLRDGDAEITGLLPALVFWRLAVDEYALARDDVRWTLDHPDERPVTRIDQARAEQSIQNTYKAFEALIGGQAPKDRSKFARRLTDLGIDPSASIRLPDGAQDTLIERLVRLWDLRSTRAAHGGPTGVADRSVTWHEVVECHWTIWHCIYERTEHLLKQHD